MMNRSGALSLGASAALTLLLTGCAGSKVAPELDWLPDASAWTVQDVDDAEPPTWVAYERDALVADVAEVRVVGLVEAPPEVTMAAMRHRLLDPAYVPEGFELEIVSETEEEVITYGLGSLPFPFRDREVTERMVFGHDPETGVYWVEVEEVDTDEEPARGVVRVPLVRNSFVVTPYDDGASVLTVDSVHDMGSGVLNRRLPGPVREGMVALLHDVRDLSASDDYASD